MKWFGSSGVRGIAFKDFTLDLASKIGFAVGSRYRDIVIGRDARLTGPLFTSAVSAALMSVGANVCDFGIVTTPTLAFSARDKDCGVMITASHNPPEYNGVKLWNPDGSAFDTHQMEEIESLMTIQPKWSDWKSVGTQSYDHNATGKHADAILSRIGESNLKVVIDCSNGPASLITPYVIEKMGCNVITLNAHLDGRFPGRPAEPTEQNLSALMNAVRIHGADLGIAHDGDADRMVAIDDAGKYVGGDVLLKVFAKELGVKSMVSPVDSTMLLDDWFGENLHRTRVGDAFVSEKVKQVSAGFGGEPSGTWIFPDISFCPDGIYAAAKLVEICSKKKLSDIVGSLQTLPMIKTAFNFDPSRRETIIKNLERNIVSLCSKEIDRTDGYRLRFDDGWALIRLSGTEPKVRIAVEARSQERAEEIMENMKKIAEGSVK